MRLDGGNKSLGSYVVLVTQVPTSFHLSLLGSYFLSSSPSTPLPLPAVGGGRWPVEGGMDGIREGCK